MSAELRARCTAAAAALAGFDRGVIAGRAAADYADAVRWAFRLAAELQSLLRQIGTESPATSRPSAYRATSTGLSPDGTATLSREDLLTVLGALRDAREFTDPASASRYAALAYRLGMD